MPAIEFSTSATRGWSRVREGDVEAWATGYAFSRGRLLEGDLLAAEACRAFRGREAFLGFLRGLNGAFALAVRGPSEAVAAVDQIRSIPLCYALDAPAASDHISALERDGASRDATSLLEYAAAGYCTGPYTVYRDIRSLQAGECAFHRDGAWTPERYYEYRCSYDSEKSGRELIAEHDAVLLAAFERCVESLRGRQVVIPLSGGFDSRLVALMLKRVGYENVRCVVYGLEGNREVEASRRTAKLLGYAWEHFVYDGALVRDVLRSELYQDFQESCTRGVSMSYPNEWPMLRAFREQGLVDPDAVFISGVSGDFTAGSHLKYLLHPEFHADPLDLHPAILEKHFCLWRDMLDHQKIRKMILARLDETLAWRPYESVEEAAAAYERWEWQERQAKYGVDFVRGYEFFGYGWRLPLWDVEYMDFWRTVPWKYKLESWLYRAALHENDLYGVFTQDLPGEPLDRTRAFQRRKAAEKPLKNWLKQLPVISGWMRNKERRAHHRHMWRYTPTGFPRAWSLEEYMNRDLGKRHDQSLVLRDFLLRHYDVDVNRLCAGDLP